MNETMSREEMEDLVLRAPKGSFLPMVDLPLPQYVVSHELVIERCDDAGKRLISVGLFAIRLGVVMEEWHWRVGEKFVTEVGGVKSDGSDFSDGSDGDGRACRIDSREAEKLEISTRGRVVKEFPELREMDVEVRSIEFGTVVMRLDDWMVRSIEAEPAPDHAIAGAATGEKSDGSNVLDGSDESGREGGAGV